MTYKVYFGKKSVRLVVIVFIILYVSSRKRGGNDSQILHQIPNVQNNIFNNLGPAIKYNQHRWFAYTVDGT